MGLRFTTSVVANAVLVPMLMLVLLLPAACGGSDDREAPLETDPASQVDNSQPLVPTAFELPSDCDELAVFSQDAADAYDAAEVASQALIDAKARFDAAVGEQVLLGCI